MNKAKRILTKSLIVVQLLSIFYFSFPRELESANLTSVSDTLSTSRLSVHARNAEDLTAGSTVIKLATSGGPPYSYSTANIFPGDTIQYTASDNSYTVENIIDNDEFSIGVGLSAVDDDANDQFIVERTANHVIDLTTASAIANGAIRVRVKADSSNNNDGDPDDGGFDFNSLTNTDVTCPADVAGQYDFDDNAKTATASGGTNCPAGYHCFECRYSGTGGVGVGLTNFTIGGTNKLINPSPASGHSEGTADTYAVIVENLDASHNVIDSTTIKVAVIEAVRVTATVEPSLTFQIAGVAASVTACENTLDVGTSATHVPFGSVTLESYMDTAQQLSVTTNSSSGYAVTVLEDDQMSINGDGVTEIPDTDCDNENCTASTPAEWSSETDSSGFGYSIHNIDANSVPFEYSTATGNCSGTFCARPFSDSTAIQIMANTSKPSSTEDIYMCYRLVVDTTQQAGNYENALTYVATATF